MIKSTNKGSDNDVIGNFDILPDEVVMEVLNFLPSVEKLYLISKQWFNLIKKNRQFYLKITSENIAMVMNSIRTGPNSSSGLNFQVHLSVYEVPSNEDLKLLGSSFSIGKIECHCSFSPEQYNCLFPGNQSLTHLECYDGGMVDLFLKMVNLKSLVLRSVVFVHSNLTDKLSKLSNLTSLELSTRKSIFPVDEVEKLTNLQVLLMRNFYLDDPTTFYKMKNLSNLTNLEIVCCYDMGTILANTISNYEKLTHLRIFNCQVGDEGVKYFEQLTKLTYLDLGHNNLTLVGAKYLASLTNLKTLYLPENDIGNEGLKFILPSSGLTYLDVRKNTFSYEGISYLKQLKNLQHLNLTSCKLTYQDITPLSECVGLTELWLHKNKLIGDEGAKLLAKSMKLRFLGVSDCGIKYSGLKVLGKSKKIESIEGTMNDINMVQRLMLVGYKKLIL